MGLDADLPIIRRGALLHDIGKIGIPDEILRKPGSLTKDEWEIVKRHPVYAYEMLEPISYIRPSVVIPYCHHEHWDGSGYPQGLKGEAIPLFARLFAVIDVWDALCSDRPYRRAMPENEVLTYLQDHAGSHFDPAIVEMFVLLRSKVA
jgi:HD-GYP domain-containing protein (c-di-GMP phosphodiesterase class II)